jgi:hypothetical protein
MQRGAYELPRCLGRLQSGFDVLKIEVSESGRSGESMESPGIESIGPAVRAEIDLDEASIGPLEPAARPMKAISAARR